MSISPLILFGLVVLVCVSMQSAKSTKPARFPHLQGWQKLFGVLAFITVVLVVINPEFLALGLVGDAAFFDAFVLLLSLQFQSIANRAWRFVSTAFTTVMRAMGPRLKHDFAMLLLIFLPIADVLAGIQKAIHRTSS